MKNNKNKGCAGFEVLNYYFSTIYMQDLVSARHGKYSGARLNDRGKEQMRTLADYIEKIMYGRSIYLVTSTAPRAIDSGEIIADRFGLTDFESLDYLWAGPGCPANSYEKDESENSDKKLVAIVEDRRKKADGIVVVSHIGVADSLAFRYIAKYEIPLHNYDDMYAGEGIHIDLKSKNAQLIPPRDNE